MLILDEEDQVLLVRFEWPGGPEGRFWANPGGGVEPGESRLQLHKRHGFIPEPETSAATVHQPDAGASTAKTPTNRRSRSSVAEGMSWERQESWPNRHHGHNARDTILS